MFWQHAIKPRTRGKPPARPSVGPPEGHNPHRGAQGAWRCTQITENEALWERLCVPSRKGKRAQAGGQSWVPSEVRPKDRAAFQTQVVKAIQAMCQRERKPESCGTDAGSVLSLWRKLGRPPIAELAADLAELAAAARTSHLGIFAQDLRGEGRKDGVDRSTSVATLCRHERYDERLAAAKHGPKRGGREPVPEYEEEFNPEDLG